MVRVGLIKVRKRTCKKYHIYHQNMIVINVIVLKIFTKSLFFNYEEGLIDQREERRRWRTCRKSRFSRLHPRFISNSKPNQSINQSNGMLLRMISNKFQRNEQMKFIDISRYNGFD